MGEELVKQEIVSAYLKLVEEDGAGTWPPKTDYVSWPRALRGYKEIYLELSPLLATAEPSLDDDTNQGRRIQYRSLMRKLLSDRISIPKVGAIMEVAETGNFDLFPRDAYNGFYCCVAVLRHAYRWATIPVVKVAQEELVVDLPPELEIPWPYLQRHFGVDADSGNNTANVLMNFTASGERVFKINVGLNETVTRSEDIFFHVFYEVEVKAVPIYDAMVRAIVAFDQGDKMACLEFMRLLGRHQRKLMKSFYENIHDHLVSRSVWLSHVQGFQGWGAGRLIDGEFVKYDGLSGNHVLVFQAIDAFLGLDRYLTEEAMKRYIPINQRNFCDTLKKHSFRSELRDTPVDLSLNQEFINIVNQMRVFRAAHRTRVMPYLEQPAPERLVMTAGKSVLETNGQEQEIKEVLKPLDDMMVGRLRETV
ncbi:hypothetical protein PFICI_01686 [Pestalotiopsis fici W106-1]|uniref:Indoleamine 2,3-dioxygenase n=1 Tax=Pestalotiopsis fici (strain W106-1 / CGMCC3.15140) TaxID=1229662 RepID=W3XP72_PESFW|nr:uncharacterized protein PFICI_01686 [Pestalotiopsis fici W106-1]ETS87858.1 hypothetical protein PFICI_01686 [Pestalotiopsis fici W106-1]